MIPQTHTVPEDAGIANSTFKVETFSSALNGVFPSIGFLNVASWRTKPVAERPQIRELQKFVVDVLKASLTFLKCQALL